MENTKHEIFEERDDGFEKSNGWYKDTIISWDSYDKRGFWHCTYKEVYRPCDNDCRGVQNSSICPHTEKPCERLWIIPED